jgi:hypothetical protein
MQSADSGPGGYRRDPEYTHHQKKTPSRIPRALGRASSAGKVRRIPRSVQWRGFRLLVYHVAIQDEEGWLPTNPVGPSVRTLEQAIGKPFVSVDGR